MSSAVVAESPPLLLRDLICWMHNPYSYDGPILVMRRREEVTTPTATPPSSQTQAPDESIVRQHLLWLAQYNAHATPPRHNTRRQKSRRHRGGDTVAALGPPADESVVRKRLRWLAERKYGPPS